MFYPPNFVSIIELFYKIFLNATHHNYALLNKSKIFIFWHYSPVGGDKDARKEKLEGV